MYINLVTFCHCEVRSNLNDDLERMVWAFSVIHFPATGTRFFILLIEIHEISNIKRAQTIPVSGLDC